MTAIPSDATVTFTADNLGLMEGPNDKHFTGLVVDAGKKGQYVGPSVIDGYHVIAVFVEGRVLYCPATTRQFTVENS